MENKNEKINNNDKNQQKERVDNIVTNKKNNNKKKKIVSIVIIIMLVIVIVIITLLKIINTRGLAINTEKYTDLEKYLVKKTMNLVSENDFEFENNSKNWIRIDKLVSNNVIEKEKVNNCNGYVTIDVGKSDEKKYKSYIKCSSRYVTKGYNKKHAKKGNLNIYGKNLYFYRDLDNPDKIVSEHEKLKDRKLLGKYSCNKILCRPEEVKKDLKHYVVTHNDKYIVINDEPRLSIYDYKNNKKIKTSINSNKLPVFLNNIKDIKNDEKYYGIVIDKKEGSILYSFKDNKVLYESKNSIFIPNQEYINRGYVVIKNTDLSSELLNLNKLKIKKNSKLDSTLVYGYDDTLKMPIIYNDCKIDFLDLNMDRVFNRMYSYTLNLDNSVYVYDSGVSEYNILNKTDYKIEKKNINYPILGMLKNYIVVNKNNMVTLIDYNGNTVKKITAFNSNKYDAFTSGYYDGHDDRPSGLYLMFHNDDCSVSFEYHYNETTKVLTKYKNSNGCMGYGKPVLYLYPEKETNVTVNFEKEENLTTTYPKFENEWKVLAKPNGDLYDQNGKYYYGLYWEESLNHRVDFSSGFYVTKYNAIDFLEEKLAYIGLNDREKNEFIMYWLPILEKNGKNIVYFELTEERNNFNKLIINPKPDSLLRIAIHVKKVDKKVDIKEQKLEKFKRDGFSAVEWGGINY